MPPSILVVDDDRLFREAVTDVLAQRGHQVTAAENATRALELFARSRFDLVVTDIVMPGVDGLQLVACMREHDPQQEVILVTGRKETNVAATAVRAGVSEYLTKPLNDSDLLLAVGRCLERALLRRERSRLLDENLEFSRHQSIHQRSLDLLSNPDLEWVQERILNEMSALLDAQSAAIWIADRTHALHLRAYRGLTDKQVLPDRLDPDGEIGPRLREGAPWLSGEGRARMLYVPMLATGELMGLVQLSDPLGGEFRTEPLKGLKTLADFAALAIKNGRRILGLQQSGLRDRESAAYTLSYFIDYASKEIYKARRYERAFSLLAISIDNLHAIRLRLGVAPARRATRGILRALGKIIRDSDVVAKASEREFYVLLPETDYFGAVVFARRAMALALEDPDVLEVESRLPLALTHGASAFPKDGDDFDELVHQCRQRMEARRNSLQRRLHLDGLSFWEEVELLLGSAQSPRLPVDDQGEPSCRGTVAETLFDDLQREIAREILRTPNSRGLVYVGGPEVSQALPVVEALEGATDLASRVYLLGRRKDLGAHAALTPVYLEGDERMARHQFILWFSENSSYALVQRPGRGATWGFHSSDAAVVDGLIARLQAQYDLQPY